MDDTASARTVLTRLRAQLDLVDDQILDLLVRRASIVDSVGRDGGKTGAKIRPGREAAILRRLIAKPRGVLPAQAVTRFWREIFAASLIIEGGHMVAVCEGEGAADRLALAREHFGPLTPMRRHTNPAQTLAEVAREAAQLAVLPPPDEAEDGPGGWWQLLTASGVHRLYVIAKLPFWGRRAEGSPLGVAYVVAGVPPDASGQDHGLISLELPADVSRTRLTALAKDAGFTPLTVWVRRGPGEGTVRALIEVAGFVEDGDPRLAAIVGVEAAPIVIGGFAVPVGDEA
jgi:chorismate mutase/prephenate dehydratase